MGLVLGVILVLRCRWPEGLEELDVLGGMTPVPAISQDVSAQQSTNLLLAELIARR